MDEKPASNNSDPPPRGAGNMHIYNLDRLLSKYVAVWLWSIIFGTTTGVLYSFLSFRYDRWGGLGIVLLIPAIVSLTLAILSWLSLYRGLSNYLIPLFFRNPEANIVDLAGEHFSYNLKRAFMYFIYAAAFRAFAGLLELLLSSSSRGMG